MDTFIDKIAKKRNAQEMILANMSAEAVKMEQMQNQMKAYDEMMQEIRRVNLTTAVSLSEVQSTLDQYMGRLDEIQENYGKDDETKQALEQLKALLENNGKDDETKQTLEQLKALLENNDKDDETKQTLEQLKALLESNGKNEETMQALVQLKEHQEEGFRQSGDFLHKENVKVYRNVQAAITEELDKQTEELKKSQIENRTSKALLPISIAILAAVVVDIAIHVFSIIISL